jgi:hypothetical protein
MSNHDWFYDQGSPDPYEEEPEECSSCGRAYCVCDEAYENYKEGKE